MKRKTPSTARIEVSAIPSSGTRVEVYLGFAFEPEDLGPDKVQDIWERIAHLIAAVLEPEDYPAFLEKLDAANVRSKQLQSAHAVDPLSPNEPTGKRQPKNKVKRP